MSGLLTSETVAVESGHPAQLAQPGTRVAPFVLARRCALPVGATSVLVLKATAALLDEAAQAQATAARIAGELEEALYELVPRVGADKELRRAVLGLRRDVHNHRAHAAGAVLLARVASALGEHAPLLSLWESALAERDRLLAAAERELERELPEVPARLTEQLRRSDVLAGLALLKPTLATKLKAHGPSADLATAESHFGRDCTAALVRVAMRTSPFSTLTTIGLVGLEQSATGSRAPSGQQAAIPAAALAGWDVGGNECGPRREVLVLENPALGLGALLCCACVPGLAGAFRFRVNPSVTAQPGAPALVPLYHQSDGFLFREEELLDVDLYSPRLGVLSGRGDLGLEQVVELTGADEAWALRMVRLGLLVPVAPWERGQSSPLRRLAEAVRPAGQLGVRLAEGFEQVAAGADGFAEANATERLVRASNARDAMAAALSTIGRPSPWGVDGTPLCYEEVYEAHDGGTLPAAVGEELAHLGELVRPHFVVSSFYRAIVDDFVARYGYGGRCDDLLAYLFAFSRRADLVDLVGETFGRDRGRVAGATEMAEHSRGLGPTVSRPSMSVLFQVAARDRRSVERGELMLVPNLYAGPTGALGARFAAFASAGTSVRAWLGKWTEGLFPEASIFEVPVAADWSSLQRGLGRFPVVGWPAEVPMQRCEAGGGTDRSAELDLREVALAHDPRTGSLVATRGDGAPVAFAYFGTVPPFLVRGPVRLLLTLSDPWLNNHRVGWQRYSFEPPLPAPAGIEHSARLVSGRTVLRRARWRMAAEDFPRRQAGEAALAFLRRARSWRKENALPAEVFVSGELPVGGRKTATKPTWVDFGSLHALSVVAEMAGSGCRVLQVVEALPARDQCWVTGADGEPAVTEYMGLVRLDAAEAAVL